MSKTSNYPFKWFPESCHVSNTIKRTHTHTHLWELLCELPNTLQELCEDRGHLFRVPVQLVTPSNRTRASVMQTQRNAVCNARETSKCYRTNGNRVINKNSCASNVWFYIHEVERREMGHYLVSCKLRWLWLRRSNIKNCLNYVKGK